MTAGTGTGRVWSSAGARASAFLLGVLAAADAYEVDSSSVDEGARVERRADLRGVAGMGFWVLAVAVLLLLLVTLEPEAFWLVEEEGVESVFLCWEE